ncbi:uncharacterized protein LOC123777869 [Ursus americanus]|uniref:uncharacterized protein LOC123777869 n=1 Tax=Ursus americanus TaxID=9643 RepID=UPI001E67DAB1|nr:uncharacterized protein LOC123777869 [Ursus americanus]
MVDHCAVDLLRRWWFHQLLHYQLLFLPLFPTRGSPDVSLIRCPASLLPVSAQLRTSCRLRLTGPRPSTPCSNSACGGHRDDSGRNREDPGCSPSRQDPGLPSGCPGLWRDWPHGVKSRWCFIGCDSIQRLHTDGPRHAGGAQAQRQNDGRHPQSTLSSAAPGAPCAGNGMRGFYETTPCLLRAGFSKCENRHLKKTWDQEESEDAGRAGRTEAARGRQDTLSRLGAGGVRGAYCGLLYGFSKERRRATPLARNTGHNEFLVWTERGPGTEAAGFLSR